MISGADLCMIMYESASVCLLQRISHGRALRGTTGPDALDPSNTHMTPKKASKMAIQGQFRLEHHFLTALYDLHVIFQISRLCLTSATRFTGRRRQVFQRLHAWALLVVAPATATAAATTRRG